MKRREFLKLVGLAVVSPKLPTLRSSGLYLHEPVEWKWFDGGVYDPDWEKSDWYAKVVTEQVWDKQWQRFCPQTKLIHMKHSKED